MEEDGKRYDNVETFTNLQPAAANKMIRISRKPLVFKGMIEHWKSRRWTVEYLCKKYGDLKTTFKICPINAVARKRPVMETECEYRTGKFADFITWLNGDYTNSASLKQFSRENFSVYIDYKYMKDLMEENPETFMEIDWGALGFEGRNGRDSTLWIGSCNAFTPLHKDTYGFNLVAQLSGKKSWTLFPPEDDLKLYQTRLPYEESSVFSHINIKHPDFEKFPEFKDATGYMAVLDAGDVLFVPKHWWHFVENIESSVSVNAWIEMANDQTDQLKEAIVRLLLTSFKESENPPLKTWLNPNEVSYSQETNVCYVKQALQNIVSGMAKKNHLSQQAKVSIDTDTILDCLVSNRVVNAIVEELVSVYNNKIS